jgi:uncharacterized membrane protein
MVIYTVGAFLIGIGVVSFVAAHWMAIPHQLKVCLLFAAMLGAHGLGFWLWKVSQRSAALGHALIILGTLIFGANIGLMAQIFHVEGRWNGLFLPWAAGAIVMAYAVQSTPNALIAVVTSFVWFTGGIGWGREVCWYYPFAAAAAFLPYCYWRKSAFVWTCTLLAVAAGTLFCTGRMSGGESYIGAALVALGLLYTCAGVIHIERFESFRPAALFLGYVAVSTGVYLASFRVIAHGWVYCAGRLADAEWPDVAALLAVLTGGVLLITPAVLWSRNSRAAIKALGAVIAAFGLFLVGSMTASQWCLAMLSNVALCVLAAVLIWAARDCGDRRLFWAGVVLVALMVTSRTLEYETGLLVKAAVFTIGGAAVIAAGVMFERFLKARRIGHE